MININILFIVIGLVVIYFIWRQSKKQNTANQTKGNEELNIKNVDVGGVINLRHIGNDMEDFDVTITAKNMYKEDGFTWYELEGDRGTSDKVWIEIEEDDELEVYVSLKEIKLRDIDISKNDLKEIDDEEEGEFTYNSEKYYYEDSGSATYYKNCDEANKEKFYYWDFLTDDEKHSIGIEKWSDDSYKVTLSEYVKLSQITIYSLKKEGD